MALQFIIGRSGSGKSTYLYENVIKNSIENPQINYLILTPDQFTLDTQKTVIAMHPNHGMRNIDIVSFHRLAHKVFEELSKEPGVILEDLGKSMVLSRILGRYREELPLFAGNRDKMGFIDELKSLLSEFYQYCITQEVLKKQLEKETPGTLLYEKLSELILILEEFERFMGQDYIVAEQMLTVLGSCVEQSESIKNSVIVLDGFTGFTPVQYELLARLLPICRQMYVAVTMDEGEAGFQNILEYELFSTSKETILRMKKIAADAGVEVRPDKRIFPEEKGRFSGSRELDFLERNLFRPVIHHYEEETKQLEIYQLLDPEEEALFAARKISSLIREKGMRYREIAIVCGDLERYGERLGRILGEYEIPYFLDDTKGMKNHPFVECIRGVFALAEFDYSYETVCHYAKNGMTSMDKADADCLDNYLLATGIRGFSALTMEFKKKPKKMGETIYKKAEQARQILLEETGELMKVFRKKRACVREYLTALYHYLVKMEYEGLLMKEAERFEEIGEYVLMSAYRQVYGAVMGLFDKIVDILGEEEMELSELRKIMDAGLDEMELGVIPPGIDQVVIGDMERTRLNQIKVLLFLGVNEGVIPKPAKGGGILSDGDREALENTGFALAPGARKSASMEQLYLYLAMTKPSEGLYLTLSQIDSEGKTIRPSYLIGRLKTMFSKLTIKTGLDEKERIFTFRSSLPFVREGMERWFHGEATDRDREFIHWLFGTPEGKNWIETALDGRFYTNGESPLSKAAARALYGLSMEASVTRLESYAGCAFAHFLKYGLMLSERQKFQIQAADLGQILHKCLELFVKEAGERESGIRNLPEKERDHLAVECLRRAVEEYGSAVFHSSARNEACIERMERLVKRTVWALTEQLRKSDFEPEELEWKFKSQKDLDAVHLQLEGGASMDLRGVIDRIDYFEDENNVYVRIIDYKSGMQTFQLADIYNGLQLQLVGYLNAVMEKERKKRDKAVVPAGIFYFHIQDPLVEEKGEMDAEEELLAQFDLSGLVLSEQEVIEHMDSGNPKSIPVSYKKDGSFTASSSVADREQFESLGNFVKGKMTAYGNQILSGNIAIAPYEAEKKTACDYCAYKGVCGFDPVFSGNKYRKLSKKDKKYIWEAIDERR